MSTYATLRDHRRHLTRQPHGGACLAVGVALLLALTSGCGTDAGSGAAQQSPPVDGQGAATDVGSGAGQSDGGQASDAVSPDAGAVASDIAALDAVGADVAAADVSAADVAAPDTTTPDTTTPDASTADGGSSSAGACTNAADQALVDSGKVAKAVESCALASFGKAEKAMPCIKDKTSLSDGCVVCFSGHLGCTFKNCIVDCMGGQTPTCDACLAKNCNASFTACSGLQP